MEPGMALEWEPVALSSSPGLATSELCKCRQMAELHWASVLLFRSGSVVFTSRSHHENVK